MSVSAAYTSGTSLPEDKPASVNVEEAIIVQNRLMWLSNPLTKEFFDKLSLQVDKLEGEASSAAQVNHQSDNHKLIVHKLIQAEALRKVVETYGSRR